MDIRELCYKMRMPTTLLECDLNNMLNLSLNKAGIDHEYYMNDGRVLDYIDYYYEERPVKGPGCNGPLIMIQDTYFACLWCFVYFFVQFGDFLVQNNVSSCFENLRARKWRDNKELADAFRLLDWAKSLKRDFSYWPDDAPSPKDKDDSFVTAINQIAVRALIYIVLHEYAHSVNKHVGSYRKTRDIPENQLTTEDIKQRALNIEMETEADQFAFEATYLEETNEEESYRQATAVFTGISFMLFLLKKPEGIRSLDHPDVDTRIINQVEQVGLNENMSDRLWFHILLLLVDFLDEHNLTRHDFSSTETVQQMCHRILDYIKELI